MWNVVPPMPQLDPPKHPRVLLRESEIDRQLGLRTVPSRRERLMGTVGRMLVHVGTHLLDRVDSPYKGKISARDAEQT